MRAQTAVNEQALAAPDGTEFGKFGIANEFAYHKTMNSALEIMLIPSASNFAHKSVLQTGLKIVKRHRQHAKEAAIVLK